jgi:hypothetical protein
LFTVVTVENGGFSQSNVASCVKLCQRPQMPRKSPALPPGSFCRFHSSPEVIRMVEFELRHPTLHTEAELLPVARHRR